MAQPHLEVFASEFHMLQFFGKYLPKLDVTASARLAPFLYKYEGNLVLARNLYDFLTQMEELTALSINIKASLQKGKAFLVFFDKELKDAEKFAANSTPRLKEDSALTIPVDISRADVSSLIQTTLPSESETEVNLGGGSLEKPLVVEVTPEAPTEKVFSEDQLSILAQAEALRDDTKKGAAKAALEQFALGKGISLSKAKTFDGMLEDLRASL